MKLKDLQRASWINYELSRKPYFGFNQKDDVEDPEDKLKDGVDPKEQEELKALAIDPEVIALRKKEDEKQRRLEHFTEKVHHVFDPLSFIAKETEKLSEEKKTDVYKIQTEYWRRLMSKDSNNIVYGLPEYLDKFKL